MNRQAGGEAKPGEADRGVRDPTVTASSSRPAVLRVGHGKAWHAAAYYNVLWGRRL